MIGPTTSEGLLMEPTAFFAKTRNSYLEFCVRPDTVNWVSITLVKLAFVHLPSGRSRFSTMYPVILLPPSNAGFCQERVIEVLEISEARTFLGGSAEGNKNIANNYQPF